MFLSKVLYETIGDVSLRYQELLGKESWSLPEAIAILLGKVYFESENARTFVEQDEIAQRIFQLAFESIMANSLEAKQCGNDFSVIPTVFIKWWASKGFLFSIEPNVLDHVSKVSDAEPTLSFREIVNKAKIEIRDMAQVIWRKNPTWTSEQIIDYHGIKEFIVKLERKIGHSYGLKTYKSWISICDPRPKEARSGRPKKELP